MRRSRRLRFIATLLLLEITFDISFPIVSLALTAGPTAPEATSFEPVDTTDLVDLKTGDFTYNIPLLEVPGPAGGYPVSLSYHAGIQLDQEASWTGLGWTLNPGSIFRMVSGYPDDHKGESNLDRSYWQGGTLEQKTIGVSYGISKAASVSAGLTFANDTYKGRGVGGYVSAGMELTKNGRFRGNVTVGMSPYGGAYTSTGVGVKAGRSVENQIQSLGGLSLSSNGQNVSVGGTLGPYSALGASISSGGSQAYFSVGGATAGIYNAKQNHVSINSEGFDVDIPIYVVNLRLAIQYQRYWIDETAEAATYGSLYLGDVSPSFTRAFDTYDVLDLDLDVAYHDDAEKVLGGSFPDVDVYTVMGQGISGNIQPYNFRQYLHRQDKMEGSDVLSKSYELSINGRKPVEYRFVNDFSNRFEYEPDDFTVGEDDLTFEFNSDENTGEDGNQGYNSTKNHLAGSKHVEWYSNAELLLEHPGVNPYHEGFVSTESLGFTRESNEQVGGFMITNSSGVTYHYALPAYSKEEYMKSVNTTTKQDEDGERYNVLEKPGKYAYTWFLTAVTGPDYVDRNGNHLADVGDWGYWVNFKYAKWLDDYKWRNPGIGFNRDLDGEFENFSAGKKEIYYLQSIATETHIATFEKSERLDGREVFDYNGGFTSIPVFDPECASQCNNDCDDQHCELGVCDEPAKQICTTTCIDLCPVVEWILPRPMLRLDEVRLYNYSDYVAGKDEDQYVLRAIGFDYDYTLALGTPNSFSHGAHNTLLGKLTLNGLSFKGKKNVSLIPPMSFEYNNQDYEMSKKDNWGYYKSDFDEEYRNSTNETIGRLTTETSAEAVSAWSMTGIETSLGAKIKINYESDRYEEVALFKQQSFRIHEVTDLPTSNQLKLTFWEEDFDFAEFFEVGDIIDIDLIGTYFNGSYTSRTCDGANCEGVPLWPSYYPILFRGGVTLEAVNGSERYIIVSGSEFYDKVKTETKTLKKWDTFIHNDDEYHRWYTFTFGGTEAWPDYFPAGAISVDQIERPGGGVRVSSIEIGDATLAKRLVNYEYEGGTTSFEPYTILEPKILPEYEAADISPQGTRVFYKKAMLNRAYRQISLSRQTPGPGVMYKTVTVQETNVTADGVAHQLPGYSEYEFETFSEGMIDMVKPEPLVRDEISGTQNGVTFSQILQSKTTIKDFSARIGNLKSITLFNTADNQPLSKTTNHYLHDGLDGSFNSNATTYATNLQSQFQNQGLIEETYTRARIMFYRVGERKPYPEDAQAYFMSDQRHLLAGLIKKESFPSVPTGQSNINYKTGIQSSTSNISFDFYSGEPTRVLTTDSYGTRFLSNVVPAYREYPAMGLKIDNVLNRNMLSQIASEDTYVLNNTSAIDNGAIIGVVSASVQTWSDMVPVLNLTQPQYNIWRHSATYQWGGPLPLESDGSYPYTGFSGNQFDFSPAGVNNQWERVQETTLYDVLSHGLEEKDISENFSSARLDDDFRKVLGTAVNARYGEIAVSGAEYYAGNALPEGGVLRKDGLPTLAHFHTGKYSLSVGNGQEGFSYTLSPAFADLTKKYRASVWVYAPGESESQAELDKIELYYMINGEQVGSIHPFVQKNKAKSWYLLGVEIVPNGSNDIVIGVRNGTQRNIYFDDFRVHPLNASMTSYVYDPFSGELQYILDANNLYTKFEYDAMGRLVRSSKELFNFDFGTGKESFRADLIIEENKYNFGKEN
jgi:hypothetical protein